MCKQQVAPHSYDVEIDGTTYCHNCFHICRDNTNQPYKNNEHIDLVPIPEHPALDSLPAKNFTPCVTRKLQSTISSLSTE